MTKKAVSADTHQKTAEKVEPVRVKRGREHIEKCTEGFGFSGPSGAENEGLGSKDQNRVEVHHVLCCEAALEAAYPEDLEPEHVEYIEECWAITPWNINDALNCLGLPRKWAYVRDKGGTAWDTYACHQVDHDFYSEKVKSWLGKFVWGKLKKAKDDAKCEDVTPENIKTMLEGCSKEFKPLLKGRECRAAMDFCLGKSGTGMTASTWYKEFSMWMPEARERTPIPSGVPRTGLLNIK